MSKANTKVPYEKMTIRQMEAEQEAIRRRFEDQILEALANLVKQAKAVIASGGATEDKLDVVPGETMLMLAQLFLPHKGVH